MAVQNQAGLVDINTASPDLLSALFTGLGLSRTEAAALLAAMQDYRDSDRLAASGGAEPAVYPGRGFGPKNAPFEAVEELDQLPGVPASVLRRLRGFTTVATQRTGVDLALAPAALRQVLGVARPEVSNLRTPSRVSAVTAAVELADGTRFVRRAMVEHVDQPGLPFVLTSWESGAWPAPRAMPGKVMRPCLAR